MATGEKKLQEPDIESLIQTLERIGIHPEVISSNPEEVDYINQALKARILAAIKPKYS